MEDFFFFVYEINSYKKKLILQVQNKKINQNPVIKLILPLKADISSYFFEFYKDVLLTNCFKFSL